MTADEDPAAAAPGPAGAGADPQSASPAGGRDGILARKLKKIVECDLEADVELQQAVAELSAFFPENTLRTRRFLRGDIERRSLQIGREFLGELDQVRVAVDGVADVFASLEASAASMQRQLEATKAKTRDLIRQTSALQAESQALAEQEATVEEFIEKYQLKEPEVVALRDGEVGKEEFFLALERAQKIHKDCKELFQSGQQNTALEIMDQMSQFQESALGRLFRWAQSQCRNVDTLGSSSGSGREKGAQVDPLSRAVRHLRRRPALFHNVLDEYCAARKSFLVKAFLDALTVGGPGGTPRPIELHAHDPPRYIGDMLAWLHQAIPGERENLQSLLKLCDAADTAELSAAAAAVDEDGGGGVQQVRDIPALMEAAIASVTEDVCRPLTARVEQVLLVEQAPIVLHRLASLIRFYTATIKQVVPEDGALVQTLVDLDKMAYKQFLQVLQSTVQQTLGVGRSGSAARGGSGAAAVAGVGPSAHDLAPTRSTATLLALMKEILSSTSVVDEHESHLSEIVSCVVDPVLEEVSSVAAALPSTDADVFQLNSLYQLHSTLSLFGYTDARLAALAADMGLHLDTLASEQTSSLIANLGLQPICTMVAERQNQEQGDSAVPLAEVPGMEASALRDFLSKFDSFLVAPDVFLLPQTRLLVSSAHRKNVSRRSLEVVAASYAQLYHAVVGDPNSGYANPTSLMPKTPEQVSLLLQL